MDAENNGIIINHVPRILKERGISVSQFMYGARLPSGTAYSWSDEESIPQRIDIPVLARICNFLKLGFGDLLEYKSPD